MDHEQTLKLWHHIAFDKKVDLLDQLLADDVVFHAPLYLKPRKGKQAAGFILSNVIEIFENFTYHREIIHHDEVEGDSWMLEFSANIGPYKLKGIDLIRWNDEGQIVDFEVYIRPINAIQALGEAMTARIEAAGMLDKITESTK